MLDGTLLWWIDCGPNLWDFQHNETNIAAYDWDMDGKAECIMRVADGTKIHAADGTVYTIGDPSKNERSAIGAASTNGESFIHTGAEYLVYLNGATGKPYEIGSGSTPYYIDYPLKRLEAGETDLSKAWGDGYGHRSTKHFFGAPYLDGKKPSIFMARGIYTRHKMIALDVDPATHVSPSAGAGTATRRVRPGTAKATTTTRLPMSTGTDVTRSASVPWSSTTMARD